MSREGPKVKRLQLEAMSLSQWDLVTSNYKAQVCGLGPTPVAVSAGFVGKPGPPLKPALRNAAGGESRPYGGVDHKVHACSAYYWYRRWLGDPWCTLSYMLCCTT